MPRGRSFTSPGPKASGLTWTSKYGYVFMNAYGQPAVTDGLNEKGLGFGALYLPGETEYETVKAGEEGRALSNIQFGAWVLGNFATVDEVRDAVGDVRVWAEFVPQLGSFSPLHYSYPRRLRQEPRHRVRRRHRARLRQQDRRADQLADLRLAHPELAQLRQPDGRERRAREARQRDLRRHRPGLRPARAARRSDAALALRHGGGNVLPRRQAEGRGRRAHRSPST